MRASSLNNAVANWRYVSLLLTVAVTVAGCETAEYDRQGTWKPTGANDQNLRAMLVRPQDEYAGTGASTARADSGARAVTRLLVDKRRPLLNVSVAHVGAGGDAPADSAVPSSGGGGGSAQ